MFCINDTVNYGTTGISTIIDIKTENIGKDIKKFYILKPLFDNNSTVMVPVDNEVLVSRIYPILTKEQANKLITELPDIQTDWIQNDRERYPEYKNRIISGDRHKIFGVLITLKKRQKHQMISGRKLRSLDEKLLRDAQKTLYTELAYVLDVSQDEIPRIIKKSFDAAEKTF